MPHYPKTRPEACLLRNAQGLLLNRASLELLTNGAPNYDQFIAVIRKPDGTMALRPVKLPENTILVRQLVDKRRIHIGVSGYGRYNRFVCRWNDVDKQLELTEDRSL